MIRAPLSRLFIRALPALLVLDACGLPLLNPRLSDAPPLGARDAEYEVYSHVLAAMKSPLIIEATTRGLPFCDAPGSRLPFCWSDRVSGDFLDAKRDYGTKNKSPVSFKAAFSPDLPVQFDRSAPPTSESCTTIPRVTLSRVGFNTDTTKAVISFRVTVGTGPYPGCGFMYGGLLFLARKPGRAWTTWRSGSGWIT